MGAYSAWRATLWLVATSSSLAACWRVATPRAAMRVHSLDIRAPGTVRLGANGKLDLAGDGTPLTGDGLVDMTTNLPNGIEYTGRATGDLLTAGAMAASSMPDLSDGVMQQQLDRARRDLPTSRADYAPGFRRHSSLTLARDENYFYSAVIDAAGGFAYFGAWTTPGIVVKIILFEPIYSYLPFVLR
jgi:hypothetical protein